MNSNETAPRCPITGEQAVFYCRKDTAEYYVSRNCGVIFLGKKPSVKEMENYANEQFKSGCYKDYLEAKDMKLLTANERLNKIAAYGPGNKLLDVGSAAGFFIEAAEKRGFDVHGVEFAAAAIAAANPSVRDKIRQGDIHEILGTLTDRFDIVTAFDIIEHMHDPAKFVRDIKLLLKPYGLLVISTPDTGHYLRYIMGAHWSMLQPYQHMVLFSREAMRRMLESEGYLDVRIEKTHKILTPAYLARQLEEPSPAVSAILSPLLRVTPRALRGRSFRVNIGEFIVFARRSREG